jgi:hypothetical protein
MQAMFSASKGDVIEPLFEILFLVFRFLAKGLSRQDTENWVAYDWITWLLISLFILAVGFILIKGIIKLCSKK